MMDLHMIAAALARLRYKVWGFGESIAMEALLRSGGAPADFAANLIRTWAYEHPPLATNPLSHVAPGVPLLMEADRTGDPALMRRALEAATVTDGPTRIGEAFKMAESLIRDVADAEVLREHLRRMAADVAQELVKRNLLAHTIRVKFRRPDFTTFTRQRSLEVATDDAATIFRVAHALWREHWPAGRPMRLLGVGAASLVAGEGRQMGLFQRGIKDEG